MQSIYRMSIVGQLVSPPCTPLYSMSPSSVEIGLLNPWKRELSIFELIAECEEENCSTNSFHREWFLTFHLYNHEI